jgi:hypothetical protein
MLEPTKPKANAVNDPNWEEERASNQEAPFSNGETGNNVGKPRSKKS